MPSYHSPITIVVFMALLAAAADHASAQSVRGTHWTDASDSGGCSVPNGNYVLTDAIALGQSPALGDLQYRPGLCGQVLIVTCESGVAIPAVVVSTCDIGSGNCGVDMITKTWNKATKNAPFGEAKCSVTKSSQNPMAGGTRCFHRYGSATDAYSRILGVMNTGGELVASATLAGQPGTHSSGAWFEFNANGQPLFKNGAAVEFTYESGAKAKFTLDECAPPGGVQIFS